MENDIKKSRKEQSRKYYLKNKERILEKQKQYYEKNKEKKSVYQKKYWEENKERHKERNRNLSRKNYYENQEKYKEYQKKYYIEHKEEINEKAHNKLYSNQLYRAYVLLHEYNAADERNCRGKGDLTTEWIVENIFSQPCPHCGETDWTKIGCNRLDNNKPHTMDNVEPCCKECNSKLNAISAKRDEFGKFAT